MSQISAITPERFTNFGDLLKFLRRRAGLSQRELSIAVGYSKPHISRLETNERIPDTAAIAARFVPELDLEQEPLWVARLLELAAESHVKVEAPEQADETPLSPTPKHNLPPQFTSFVGREKEIAEITRLLTPAASAEHSVRLLTLTGAGGSGKTRLALRAATELLPKFSDGVYFVNLAPLTESALVIPTIAQALSVNAMPRQSAQDALQEDLRGKQLLLVLDNFEQVLDAAPAVAELVKLAHNLRVIVTGRVRLHISGEHDFRVLPLQLPGLRGTVPEELEQNEAVALFVERARQARPDLQWTETLLRVVADICVRLDGLPLAIELAAARTRVLAPDDLLARLSRRLVLLTGGARDMPARQQTLRNTIDWSYRLLPPDEQTLFARLSVFVGGWSVESAEQICDANGDLRGQVLDGLQTLVEHNLIQERLGEDETVRFTMLETLREYASEELSQRGENETLQQLHANYFAAMADASTPKEFLVTNSVTRRMFTERYNFRAALARSLSTGIAEIGARLVLATIFTGFEDSKMWYERALARADRDGGVNPYLRARVLFRLGDVLALLGDYSKGRELFASCLEIFRTLGNPLAIVRALEKFGWVEREQGNPQAAVPWLQEALALARELGDDHHTCMITNTLGEALVMQGDTTMAKEMLEQALPLARQIGDNFTIGFTLNHLGHAAQAEGQFTRARYLHLESLAAFQKMDGRSIGLPEALYCLGETAIGAGDSALAKEYLHQALSLAQDMLYRIVVAWSLAGLAGVAVLNEEPERAARLWGAAQALRQRLGVREGPATHDVHQRLMAQAREQLGEQAFAAAWKKGSGLRIEDAIALALFVQEKQ